MSKDEASRIDEIMTDSVDYYELSSRLIDEANNDRLLLLLADVMRMMMTSGGDGDRFKPFVTFTDGSSSFFPGLLTDDDVALLRSVQTSNAAIRARVADILWERSAGSERVMHVQRSIDAYLELAAAAPWHDAEDYLRRANDLATRFRGADNGAREERVRETIRRVLHEASEPARLIGACSLLRAVGADASDSAAAANALEHAAAEAERDNDISMTRGLCEELRSWKKTDDPTRHDVTARIADLWVHDADLQMAGGNASAFVAASFIENAIQTLRSIPRPHRVRLAVNDRVSALRSRMGELNEAAMDEMSPFESDPVDLSDAAADARARITGREPLEALIRFTSMIPLADQAKDRAAAEKLVAGSIANMFSTTTFTHDGRVADKSTADDAIDRQMGQSGQLRRHLYTVGMILPALHQLREEHTMTLSDFAHITLASAVVPPGSEGLVAAGLHAGWNLDMGVAVHLLVPRIEAIVRHHLKSAGVITTHLDQEGRENELSLPSLLEKPEAAEVFGAALVYELEGLFAGRFGSNLRHDIAHGLVNDATANTVLSVYAWWLALRLVLVPFFNQMVEEGSSDPSVEDS